MRRVGEFLGAVGGGALIAAAFLPFVTKEGGDIPTAEGTISGSVGELGEWFGWVVFALGVAVLIAGLVLFLVRSRIVAALMFVMGTLGAGLGIWAVIDPFGLFVRVSALRVGMDPDEVSALLRFLDQSVSTGTGAWVASAGGVIAGLVGVTLVFIPKRSSALPSGAAELKPSGVPSLGSPTENAMPPSADTRPVASVEAPEPGWIPRAPEERRREEDPGTGSSHIEGWR